MRELEPAWPPTASLDDEGAQTLRRPVDAGGETGGAGADDDNVVERFLRLGAEADPGSQFHSGGLHHGRSVAKEDDRKFAVVETFFLEQRDGFRRLLRVQPLVFNPVAGEEVAHGVVGRRPAQADHADAFVRRLVALFPGLEQLIEYGVKLLFGGVPGLVEVVVNLGGVDGPDGGFGIGVRGEEHTLGVREHGHGLLQEVDAGHAGHALVGEEEGNGLLALDQLAADVEGRGAQGGAQDAIALAVVAAQILHHSFEYAGVVVDGEEDRLWHRV